MGWLIIGKCIFSCYASWRLRRAQKKLDRIKLNNYRQAQGLPRIYSFGEKISRRIFRLLKPCIGSLKQCFCPCCIDYDALYPNQKRTFYQRIWIRGTKENYIAKCLAGIVGTFHQIWCTCALLIEDKDVVFKVIWKTDALDIALAAGIFLSVMLWKAVHADPINLSSGLIKPKTLQVQREPSIAVKAVIIILGVCLTCALTFSEACRCILILALLQFFTNKGRVALMAYILVLAISGPSRNSVTNMEILTESLACGQELVKDSVLDLFSFVTQPYKSFHRAIKGVINSLQGVFGRMRDELETVVDAVKDIVAVIKSAYNSLRQAADVCKNEFGTPHERCLRSFEGATESCSQQLGDSLAWMCSPVDIFNFLCNFAKVGDVIMCWFPSLIKQHIFEPIAEHFQAFTNEFKKFFDARLNVTYKLDHDLTRDKTFSQVYEAMKNDILGRGDWIFKYITWMDLTLLISLTIVLYKAVTYRWKFLYSDRYDNYYLSSSLIQMDIRRHAAGGESIFPLRQREFNLYVETFSWRMVKEERRARKHSVALVCIASVQILQYLLIDYVLYIFMEWIRINAGNEYEHLNDPVLGLAASVEGEGFLASMYRNILENFNPVNFVLPSLNMTVCLPVANKPNYGTYFWIIFLLSVCFMLAFFEPYGLRLRHIICGTIYPDRVVDRERWLYVHMLTTRDSFFQFAKNKIRAKVGFIRKRNWQNQKGRIGRKGFDVSCKERLVHKFPILTNCFDPTTIKCFICGSRGHHDDRENFIDCLKCNTIYCRECLEDLHDQCAACSTTLHSDAESGIDDEEMEVYKDDAE